MLQMTVYILECADGTLYTGSTIDLDRRIRQHEQGLGARYTRKRLPIRLVYTELFDRIDMAFKRENQIQTWSHAKKQPLINGNMDRMKDLSECQNRTHWKNRAG